jgi:hypothetical protein
MWRSGHILQRVFKLRINGGGWSGSSSALYKSRRRRLVGFHVTFQDKLLENVTSSKYLGKALTNQIAALKKLRATSIQVTNSV